MEKLRDMKPAGSIAEQKENNTVVVEFRNISKKFETLQVLKNLSFKVYSEDIIGILGPSGIGKSTILKLIAGLHQPCNGNIINHSNKIAYVFQEPRLLPWKTTFENVYLPLSCNGTGKKEAREKVRYYLNKIGLSGFENYYPSQLSGGMLQRVSLARAFAIEPDLLLLDEPFSALDLKLKSVLESMLKKLLRENPIPVLYVSHSPEEIVQFASRVFVMYKGGLLKEMQVKDNKKLITNLKKEILIPGE